MANLKESFTKGLTTLNVKTNNFMEESKCKTYISTLENEIKELKQQIGERVYENACNGAEPAFNTEELIQMIHSKRQEIEQQQNRILELQQEEQQILGTTSQKETEPTSGTIFCGQCGKENAANYKFCCKCGAPLA